MCSITCLMRSVPLLTVVVLYAGCSIFFFLKKNLPFQKKDREMHAKLLDNNGRLNLFVWVVGA